MTRSEAEAKIRKLLQRNGRTEHESDTAAILAAALAAKHSIDIAELDRADQKREIVITHQEAGAWAFMPDDAVYASLICQRFFEITAFKSGRHFLQIMVFIGTDQHITIARYIFEFLIGEFRRAWNRRTNKRIKKRKAFVHAAYVALYCKLEARFESPRSPQMELALEVSLKAKRQKYMDETFGEMTTAKVGPKNKKSRAAHEGWWAGDAIEIRPGVETTEAAGQLPEPTRLLTA